MTVLQVNGVRHEVREADPDMPLLYALRDEMGLRGPRFGCGLGQCGACTVLLDGQPARSCVTPVSSVEGRAVTTLEGLGTPEAPHPLQRAFIEAQAAQCGTCINGMIMQAHGLLAGNKRPTDAEIAAALEANLCRCGTHLRIVQAVRAAGAAMAGG